MLISPASGYWALANDNTLWPTSFAFIVVLLEPLVTSTITRRTARIIVEIAQ